MKSAPLLARFDGQPLQLADAPPKITLGGYGGDVACLAMPEGVCFAVSCSRAGLIAWWDTDGRWLGTGRLPGACALVPFGASPASMRQVSVRWDNHITVWQQALS